MKYQFQIANVTFSIFFPRKLRIEESFRNFFVERQQEEVRIYFKSWTEHISWEEDVLLYQGDYGIYRTSRGYAVEQREKEEPYLYMPLIEGENTQICYIKEPKWRIYSQIGQIFQIVNYERILNRNRIFLLHASFIRWNERGILFTAPSGTGKSTQAKLWEIWEKAEIINGDRTAISKGKTGWTAYGIPFAGSSRIYKNTFCPIRAVVVLRQGKENHLERLGFSEAFRWLYSEITVQYWDEKFQEILAEILGDFVLEVPVYRLECLPDKSAVDILRKELE